MQNFEGIQQSWWDDEISQDPSWVQVLDEFSILQAVLQTLFINWYKDIHIYFHMWIYIGYNYSSMNNFQQQFS